MEPQDFLTELKGIVGKLETGNAAQAATNPENAPAEVVSKATNASDPYANKEANIGSDRLAKGFIRLARESKAFSQLGTDKALEDAQGFLRRKKLDSYGRPSDQYEISDTQLELMIQKLLAMGPAADVSGQIDDRARGKLIEAASKGRLTFGPNNQMVQKALDQSSGAPLIRTDIEPFLWEAYLREFPAADLIGTIPANGIVHTYDVRTAIPTAITLSNVGDFSSAFSNSTFVRQANSNIAIIGAPVAIALKLALAVSQSGMTSFNLEGNDNLEVVGAITAIARKNQSLMLQGCYSDSAGTLSNESGLYDSQAYDGLRYILKGGSTSITKGNTDTYTSLLNRAVAQIRNSGGTERNIALIMSLGANIAVNAEFQQFYRVNDMGPDGGVDTNLTVGGIRTISKYLTKVQEVPSDAQGNGIGYYTYSSASTEDIYALDVTGCKFAYLGSPSPSILELPMGYNNQLSKVYVPFLINGLVVHVANFQRKIRIPVQTV